MRHVKTFTSLITAGAFCFSFVLCEPLKGIEILAGNRSVSPSLSRVMEKTYLPSQWGRITGAGLYESGTLVVCIQDLHCHPEVQNNISQLLGYFDRRYGISAIFAEGAPRGRVDTKLLSSLPDNTITSEVLDDMLNIGLLGGAEYYSVVRGKNTLLGLEKWDTYTGNLLRIRKILSDQPLYEAPIQKIHARVRRIKEKYLSKNIARFEKRVTKNKNSRAQTYFRGLEQLSLESGVSLRSYPNLEKYLQSQQCGETINHNKVAAEHGEYIRELRKLIPFSIYGKLMAKANDESGRDDYYRALYEISMAYGPHMRKYPNLDRFLEFIRLNNSINPVSLVYEEQAFTRRILEKHARTPLDEEILFLAEMDDYIEKFYSIRMNPEEYSAFRRGNTEFKVLLNKYDGDAGMKTTIEFLQDAEDTLFAFYETNTERNAIFCETIKSHIDVHAPGRRTDGQPLLTTDGLVDMNVLERYDNIYAMVIGGFHSGTTKLLEDNRISYITVTPSVTTGYNESIYKQLLTGKLDPAALVNSSLSPVLVDVGMPQETIDLIIASWAKKALARQLSIAVIENDVAAWMKSNNMPGRFSIAGTGDPNIYCAVINERKYELRLNHGHGRKDKTSPGMVKNILKGLMVVAPFSPGLFLFAPMQSMISAAAITPQAVPSFTVSDVCIMSVTLAAIFYKGVKLLVNGLAFVSGKTRDETLTLFKGKRAEINVAGKANAGRIYTKLLILLGAAGLVAGAFLAMIPLAPPPAPLAVTAVRLVTYTVKPGDNLWNIAKDYLGTNNNTEIYYHVYDKIAHWNPGLASHLDLIHPGDNIIVNRIQETVMVPQPGFADTLLSSIQHSMADQWLVAAAIVILISGVSFLTYKIIHKHSRAVTEKPQEKQDNAAAPYPVDTMLPAEAYKATAEAVNGEMPDLIVVAADKEYFDNEAVKSLFPHLQNVLAAVPMEIIDCEGKGNLRSALGIMRYMRSERLAELARAVGKKPGDLRIAVINLDGAGKEIAGKELPLMIAGEKVNSIEWALANGIRMTQDLKRSNRGGAAVTDPCEVYVGPVSRMGDITCLGPSVSYEQMLAQGLTLMINDDKTGKIRKLYHKFAGERVKNVLEKNAIGRLFRLSNKKIKQLNTLTGTMIISFDDEKKSSVFMQLAEEIASFAGSPYRNKAPPDTDLIKHFMIPLILGYNNEDTYSYLAKLRGEFRLGDDEDFYKEFYKKLFDIISSYRGMLNSVSIRAFTPSESFFSTVKDIGTLGTTLERIVELSRAEPAGAPGLDSPPVLFIQLEKPGRKSGLLRAVFDFLYDPITFLYALTHRSQRQNIEENGNGRTPLEEAGDALNEWHGILTAGTKQPDITTVDAMLSKAKYIMRLTALSPDTCGSNCKKTGMLYRQFAELSLQTHSRIASILNSGCLTGREIEYMNAYKACFECINVYSLEYYHALDFAINMEIMAGYRYPSDDWSERSKIMPLNRKVFGLEEGFMNSKAMFRKQVLKVIGTGNLIMDSLYAPEDTMSGFNGYINYLEKREGVRQRFGLEKGSAIRRVAGRFAGIIMILKPVLEIVPVVIGWMVLNGRGMPPGMVPVSLYVLKIILIPLGAGILLSIVLHTLFIKRGETSAFYDQKKKEAEERLLHSPAVKESLEMSVNKLAWDENAKAPGKEENGKAALDITGYYFGRWEKILEKNTLDRNDMDMIRLYAVDVIRLTPLTGEVMRDNLSRFAEIYGTFISMMETTADKIRQLDDDKRARIRQEIISFAEIYSYAGHYNSALDLIYNIASLSGYRIPPRGIYSILEVMQINRILRLLFGINVGLWISERFLRSKVEEIAMLGNAIMPGMYDGEQLKEDEFAYTVSKRAGENFPLGMAMEWPRSKMLRRLTPMILMLRPIIENNYDPGRFLVSFLTGIGISIGLQWFALFVSFYDNLFGKELRRTKAAIAELESISGTSPGDTALPAREQALCREYESSVCAMGGEMPDRVLVIVSVNDKTFFQQLIAANPLLSAVPLDIMDNDNFGEYVTLERALSKQYGKDKRIAVINAVGSGRACAACLPLKAKGQNITGLDMAIMNGIKGTQSLKADGRGGIVHVDASELYIGPVKLTGDITRIGAYVSYRQMIEDGLTLMLLTHDDRNTVRKLMYRFDHKNVINMLSKKALGGMYNLKNKEMRQIVAHTGIMIISIDGQDKYDALLDLFDKVRRRISTPYRNGPPPKFDVVAHLEVPLVMLSNKEDPLAFCVKLKDSFGAGNIEDYYEDFYWQLFRFYEKELTNGLAGTPLSAFCTFDSILLSLDKPLSTEQKNLLKYIGDGVR
ncbi:MAG: hypothetical protein A2219_00685 [Elusimicrobia bacterium RIFOXYA2_FULL_50_26]|nr:MAG: hypothetical protein A2219_00685 [Elusimicrobia bacterium RIFOXYA2_FULL_50_26]